MATSDQEQALIVVAAGGWRPYECAVLLEATKQYCPGWGLSGMDALLHAYGKLEPLGPGRFGPVEPEDLETFCREFCYEPPYEDISGLPEPGGMFSVDVLYRRLHNLAYPIWSLLFPSRRGRFPSPPPYSLDADGWFREWNVARRGVYAVFEEAYNVLEAALHEEGHGLFDDSRLLLSQRIFLERDKELTMAGLAEALGVSTRTLRLWRKRLRRAAPGAHPEFTNPVPPAMRSAGKLYSLHRVTEFLLKAGYIE